MANLSSSSGTTSTEAPHGGITRVKQETCVMPASNYGLGVLALPQVEDTGGACQPAPLETDLAISSSPSSQACHEVHEGESTDIGESAPRRQKLSPKHVQQLEAMFRVDPSGAPDRRAGLARQFGVSQQQIATWFQNRRARQRNRQLREDNEILQKCLRAAYLENQVLRTELDELRQTHALCPSPSSPLLPAAPSAALPPLPLPSAAAPSTTPAHATGTLPSLLGLPRPRSPEKRPRRTLFAPSLAAKRARQLPRTQPAAAPLLETALPPYSLPALTAMGAAPPAAVALAADPTAAATFAAATPESTTVSQPLANALDDVPPPSVEGELTLDAAFRELLTSDPLDGTLGSMTSAGIQGPGLDLGHHHPLARNEHVEHHSPHEPEMDWEGEAESCLDGMLNMHQLDPIWDLEGAAQVWGREDHQMHQPGWWIR